MNLSYQIDHIEQYVPMAKPLAYWHTEALGFTIEAYKGIENGHPGVASYLLSSGDVRLLLTSAYPSFAFRKDNEILNFVHEQYAGVKRIVLRCSGVQEAFSAALKGGAIPVRFPARQEDENGYIDQAAIRLYDSSELVFLDRDHYQGAFLPGYKGTQGARWEKEPLFQSIDHIASELRINEIGYWTDYVHRTIGIRLVQQIPRSEDNRTGMLLNISASPDQALTLVMAEPESANGRSKVQQNIDNYGPGIHHLAFSTGDIFSTVSQLKQRNVDMVSFPASYYELLRTNPEMSGFDIDQLERNGILLDKEGDAYLLQKFIKPFGDRPFFIYEIVQRINGYSGFALKNIYVLKRAEELELMQAAAAQVS